MNISLNFFSSWPKTAILDVYNTCNGDTDIIGMREFHNTYKNLQKDEKESLQRHYKQLWNMDKKTDAWKKFQNKMKDKRSSKKTSTLLHFLIVFLLAGFFGFSGAFFALQ